LVKLRLFLNHINTINAKQDHCGLPYSHAEQDELWLSGKERKLKIWVEGQDPRVEEKR